VFLLLSIKGFGSFSFVGKIEVFVFVEKNDECKVVVAINDDDDEEVGVDDFVLLLCKSEIDSLFVVVVVVVVKSDFLSLLMFPVRDK
jgi:hypothetical protein